MQQGSASPPQLISLCSSMNFVFDVESTDLHGKAFAVAAIVFEDEKIKDMLYVISEESKAQASQWVIDNVLPAQGGSKLVTVKTDREMRDMFYDFYLTYKGARVWADVPYPVETNFLEDVCNDDLENREWKMPYPLYDIASYKLDKRRRKAAIINVPDEFNYMHNDHNPVHDCIISYEKVCFLDEVPELTLKQGLSPASGHILALTLMAMSLFALIRALECCARPGSCSQSTYYLLFIAATIVIGGVVLFHAKMKFP